MSHTLEIIDNAELDTEFIQNEALQAPLFDAAQPSSLHMNLQDFVAEFGDELLDSLNRSNPPVYTGEAKANRQLILADLKRQLFHAQAEVVHAAAELLIDRGERAAIVNGEMGLGKVRRIGA